MYTASRRCRPPPPPPITFLFISISVEENVLNHLILKENCFDLKLDNLGICIDSLNAQCHFESAISD